MNITHQTLALIVAALFLSSAGGVRGLVSAQSSREALPSVERDLRVNPSADPDPRNETSIAVSPINDRIIVGASKLILGAGTAAAGSQRVAYYYSSDGGQTWGNGVVSLETPQKTWSRCSDPAVACDSNGTFYLSVLMLDDSSFDSGAYLFESTNGGRTFSDPAPISIDIGSGGDPKQVDKSYIAVDNSPSSPFRNTIHAAWIRTDRGEDRVNRAGVFVAHRRPGQFGFSEPKLISHFGDMRGPSIATGPNGEFYAAWEGIGNPRVLLFNASTDGGETFLPPSVAPGTDFRIHAFVGSLSVPSPVLNISGVPRMNSFPVIDVDRSTGPGRGMIYVAWAEAPNRTDADILVKRLGPPNGGRPEEFPPVRANDDVGVADQFFPWLSVDSSSGSVEVAFYDRRGNPGEAMNTYIARSTDGGASFENTRVSGQVSDPRIQASKTQPFGNPIGIGDYIGLASARGKGHLLWTDTREGKQDIYYGQVTFDASGGGPVPPVNDDCLSPRVITTTRPFVDVLDTMLATSSPDDPITCSGGRDSNSVWYSLTPPVDTVYGVDTVGSDYDTVLSVYAGGCGALTRVACSDDFGDQISAANRSMLTFAARAGEVYLIEASGKGSGGTLRFRLGAPTVTSVEYTTGPDGGKALKIAGASFVDGTARVTVRAGGGDTILSSVVFAGPFQGDGTYTMMFATKKKLKKLIKRGRPVVIVVESPVGSGNDSVPFTFTRP
ncbi:MAG TPA: sialidase family protein [Blastocatellia bacterium]|nr:sialidase family protein [Blastocatellia bacterium]